MFRDARIFSSILRNCIPLSAIHPGKQIHGQILLNGFLPHTTIQTDLMLMYSKCGDLKAARRMFNEMPDRNMHSWNILISFYVQSSDYTEALNVFQRFLQAGLPPDHYTFPSLFKACGGMVDLRLGNMLHTSAIKLGLEDDVIVGGSILDMYSKCGSLHEAGRMFCRMSHRDVIVWNSMISGYARGGFSFEALDLFNKMQLKREKMDQMTLSSILNVCGKEGDLMKGKEIHGQVVKSIGFCSDIVINNSLIDMYGKCGTLDYSHKIFTRMVYKNLVTWTTMISSYGAHGKGDESLVLFEKMQVQGILPNCVTFTAILASCSHSGLIHKGRKIFNFMRSDFGVEHSVEHYACMVDILGRFGRLQEALKLIEEMPIEPSSSVWGALLGACRIHKNVGLGEISAYRLFELEPRNPSNYIALSSIYEAVGRGDGVIGIRSRMRDLGLVKMPGCSWITMKGSVHRFYQGGVSQETPYMYEILDGLSKLIMFYGYV